MPLITVVETVITTFEVPEGNDINRLRYLFEQQIEGQNAAEDLRAIHRQALGDVYGEFIDDHGESTQLEIYEGPYRRV